MKIKMSVLTLSALVALTGCTHPADVSRPLTEVADKNAHFTVKDIPDGFSVEVRYSRYQFVPGGERAAGGMPIAGDRPRIRRSQDPWS